MHSICIFEISNAELIQLGYKIGQICYLDACSPSYISFKVVKLGFILTWGSVIFVSIYVRSNCHLGLQSSNTHKLDFMHYFICIMDRANSPCFTIINYHLI